MSQAVGQMEKAAGAPAPALGRIGALRKYLASFFREPNSMGNLKAPAGHASISMPGHLGGAAVSPGNFGTVAAAPAVPLQMTMAGGTGPSAHSAGLQGAGHDQYSKLGILDGEANGAGKNLPVNFDGKSAPTAPGALDSMLGKGRGLWDYTKENPWHVGGGAAALGGAGWLGHNSGYDSGARDIGPQTYQAGLQAGGAASQQAASDAGFLSRLFGDGGQGTAANAIAALGGNQMAQNVTNRILSR